MVGIFFFFWGGGQLFVLCVLVFMSLQKLCLYIGVWVCMIGIILCAFMLDMCVCVCVCVWVCVCVCVSVCVCGVCVCVCVCVCVVRLIDR